MRVAGSRRWDGRAAALAAILLGVLLLSGCGGGGGEAPSGGSGQPSRPPSQGGSTTPPQDAPEERAPERDLRSTFALDVDTASYGFARRSILDGKLPAAATVRPEEFVNALDQGYPQPDGDGFSITVDGARLPVPDAEQARVLRVGLQTREVDAAARKDAALTFVIDVSGSMAEHGRLDLVQDALHTLVEQIGRSDSVAIVAYGDSARLLLPMTRVSDKAALHAAIGELRPGGSTNLEAGLVLGYRTARAGFREDATNRVILLSDGLANVGSTTAQPILDQVRAESGGGIALLCVGVGSEYGDQLMEQLADRGDGFAVYVSEREETRRVFVDRLPRTLDLRAVDAKAQVTFDPDTVERYRLVGFENRALAPDQFSDDRVDGGEIGPGHSVTALYEVRLRPGAAGEVAEATVRWLDPVSRAPSEVSRAVTVDDVQGDLWATASSTLQADVVTAWFAESLRGDVSATRPPLDLLARECDRLARLTESSQLTELASLIHRAAALRG